MFNLERETPAPGMTATHALQAEWARFAGELACLRERGRKGRVSDGSLGHRERCGAGTTARGMLS